jgi:hypothetical protein
MWTEAVAAQSCERMNAGTSSILSKPPRLLSPERRVSSAACGRETVACTAAMGTRGC